MSGLYKVFSSFFSLTSPRPSLDLSLSQQRPQGEDLQGSCCAYRLLYGTPKGNGLVYSRDLRAEWL